MNQKNKKQNDRLRRLSVQVLKSLYVVLILAMLLSTASYSWFSLSRTPSVSDMGLFISNTDGLELSFAADAADEDWSQILDFAPILADAEPLRPVTWSHQDQCFYAANYGYDGRIISLNYRLADQINSSEGHGDTYYMKLTFFARTETRVKVGLTQPKVHMDGTQGLGTFLYGTPVWDSNQILHVNAGGGAEKAIRLGFRITMIEADGSRSDPKFIVYEPNCDVTEEGYVPTPSKDGTANLVPADQLIRQTASTWRETDPVLHGQVQQELGQFLDSTSLFTLNPGQIAQIELYIWLEGMDPDCVNDIGQGKQVTANLQFSADPSGQGGMTDIEDEHEYDD